METVQLLTRFARQRPGLNFDDYGDRKIYDKESREITKDLHDYEEVLGVAVMYIDDLDSKVKTYLQNSSGRLTMRADGKLEYITGQYFPTEYRPAATSVLTTLLWRHVSNDETLKTGHDIRKKLSKMLSKRVRRNYY